MLLRCATILLSVSVLTRGDSIHEGNRENTEEIISKNNVAFQDGLVKFEDSFLSNQGPRDIDSPRQPVRFTDDSTDPLYSNPDLNKDKTTFQDDNYIGNFQSQIVENHNQNGNKKKRRRRRRKPRLQNFADQPFLRPMQPYPGVLTGAYTNPGVSPPFRRPRPAPLLPDAISSAMAALGSIARYDDYQCVPRLLCDASGNGALNNVGSNTIVQSILRLQPLLTVLSAYNGLSSSPIYVFGRAVFLGMTSKDHKACLDAYPLCPTDTEQLVHYLNNHNGGFFRFFNSPSVNPQFGQQNLEQFYNQLLGSGSQQGQQNYGLYRPNVNQDYGSQSYGGLPQNGQQNFGLFQQQDGQNYGVLGNYGYPHRYGNQYPHSSTGYGLHNPLAQNYNINSKSNEEIKDSNVTIQRRVLTKSDSNGPADVTYLKWNFPIYAINNKFKFPQQNVKSNNDVSNYDRKSRTIQFPGDQSNRNYYQDVTDNLSKYPHKDILHHNGLKFVDDEFYNNSDNSEDNDFEIVYLVRGDGDPNHPEAVKIKAGNTYYQ